MAFFFCRSSTGNQFSFHSASHLVARARPDGGIGFSGTHRSHILSLSAKRTKIAVGVDHLLPDSLELQRAELGRCACGRKGPQAAAWAYL